MKFLVTYSQEVLVSCKDLQTCNKLIEDNMPFIEIRGAQVGKGCYDLNTGKYKILSVIKAPRKTKTHP